MDDCGRGKLIAVFDGDNFVSRVANLKARRSIAIRCYRKIAPGSDPRLPEIYRAQFS